MKKIFSFILVLVIAAATFSSVFAANTTVPGGPFASSINLQNLSTSEASVTVSYVDAGGQIALTTSHTIAAGDVLSIYVPAESQLASGEYSVVVSSNQAVAAIANFADSDSTAAYSGANAGNPVWFVPGIYNNYYNNYSEVYAQNVANASQSITLEVFEPGSSTPVYTNTKNNVPSMASVNWGLRGVTELKKNKAYSAKVTAADNVVVMSNYYGMGTIAPQLYSFNGFPAGAKKFNVPVLVNNYYGWNASLSIQNVGASEAAVRVEYSTGKVSDYTIVPNSAQSIYIPSVDGLPSGRSGLFGATITSDQDIVVVVNQSNKYNRAATYTGVSVASTKAYAPVLVKRYYNESSSLTCQNVGNAPTTMTLVLSNIAGSVTSPEVPVGGIWNHYLPSDTRIANKYIGNGTITSDGQPIACVVQSNFEDAPYNTRNMDAFKSYTAINQ